ncbi:hypothetical protein LWI29_031535 [Acer saccharum]|uniref:Uncharacterized protein n=1 Tax=Acer saccharum TaxID=4024 RepID=A0AA39SX63_ACESA|nr:hypothetical protein LWI29_031535 [Acer saccharum]
MSKESWLNTPFVNLDLLWELEDLPIDDRLDDDRDGSKSSNDDDDILNVKVLNFVPSPLDEDIKDEEFEFSIKLATNKTRTSIQRSRFKSLPYVSGASPYKRGKKFKYGLFQISRALSEIDG